MSSEAQIRAARSILGISQPDAAAAAGVSVSTLKRAEGTIQPPASAEAIAAIRSALEKAGVEFIEENGGGPGVRLTKDEIQMSDFSKRLQDKKHQFDTDLQAKAEEARAARRKAQEATNQGVKLLNEYAMPALGAAENELVKNGMALKVKTNFDVAIHVEPVPSVVAIVGSPARKSDGYRKESKCLIIEAHAGTFRVGLAQYDHGRIQTDVAKNLEPTKLAPIIEEKILDLAQEVLDGLRDS